MFVNIDPYTKFIRLWLVTIFLLVVLIIVVGGLTRLTDSGLSITEWELFKGILPPLNENSWNFYFDQYKKIPQYKMLNYNMSIEEFKIIFYWEYIHRMLARFIGIFFLLPLIYFYFIKKIRIEYMKICYLIFSLIIFQGIVGWYMVKSGLVNNVTVSHYRLSVHLSTAIIIISTIFWLIKNINANEKKKFFILSKENFPFQLLVLLIFLQIILGAFVSGLDAGKIYQTWPTMGDTYLPNDLLFLGFRSLFEFNNHSLVQFYHRNLAYIIMIYVTFLSFIIFLKEIKILYKPLYILIFFLILQASLGVFTLISDLNIYLASSHQITSVLLVFSALNLYYFKAK